ADDAAAAAAADDAAGAAEPAGASFAGRSPGARRAAAVGLQRLGAAARPGHETETRETHREQRDLKLFHFYSPPKATRPFSRGTKNRTRGSPPDFSATRPRAGRGPAAATGWRPGCRPCSPAPGARTPAGNCRESAARACRTAPTAGPRR